MRFFNFQNGSKPPGWKWLMKTGNILLVLAIGILVGGLDMLCWPMVEPIAV